MKIQTCLNCDEVLDRHHHCILPRKKRSRSKAKLQTDFNQDAVKRALIRSRDPSYSAYLHFPAL